MRYLESNRDPTGIETMVDDITITQLCAFCLPKERVQLIPPLALIAETAMISLVTLRSKLPQVMVHMKVCMARAFTSRHRTKHGMRSICARPATELIKQGTQAVNIGGIFSRASSVQVLIQLGPRRDPVWPLERQPEGCPLVHRAFEQGRGRTDLLLS